MAPDTLVLVVVAAATSAAGAIDITARRVPNPLTAAVAVIGIAIAAAGAGTVTLSAALLGGLLGLGLMLPGYLIGATGGGDVKLFAALATLLGPGAALAAFVYSAIAGAVIAVGVAASRRRLAETIDGTTLLVMTHGATAPGLEHVGPANRFPYAPAIAIGVLLAVLGY